MSDDPIWYVIHDGHGRPIHSRLNSGDAGVEAAVKFAVEEGLFLGGPMGKPEAMALAGRLFDRQDMIAARKRTQWSHGDHKGDRKLGAAACPTAPPSQSTFRVVFCDGTTDVVTVVREPGHGYSSEWTMHKAVLAAELNGRVVDQIIDDSGERWARGLLVLDEALGGSDEG